MVRGKGLEPSRPFTGPRLLRPLRLPFRHPRAGLHDAVPGGGEQSSQRRGPQKPRRGLVVDELDASTGPSLDVRGETVVLATLDGEEVNLLANIEGPKDLPAVKSANADGIGLYRTEFLFIGRDTLPDEEEQYEAYRAVVKALPGKPVTIRTFDVGADKALNGAQAREEPNPALGLRAVRYSLAEPKMFKTQLRALLRASAHGRLQIMVPMLAHAQEVDQCLTLLEKAKAELRAEKIKFDEGIRIGGMIEVPAAALSLGMFIRRLAFLSIGTNDLIQYTLAIDRSDEAVAHLYDPLHPAVLKLIAGTISSGARFGLPVSVCGEMAGDPLYTELLLGMGLRNFSMHPGSILEIKQQVLRADLGELAPRVQRILKMDEPARIREAVERLTA